MNHFQAGDKKCAISLNVFSVGLISTYSIKTNPQFFCIWQIDQNKPKMVLSYFQCQTLASLKVIAISGENPLGGCYWDWVKMFFSLERFTRLLSYLQMAAYSRLGRIRKVEHCFCSHESTGSSRKAATIAVATTGRHWEILLNRAYKTINL